MPTEDKNTIDCTFQHSQAQFRHSVPPSQHSAHEPDIAPSLPASSLLRPDVPPLGSNTTLCKHHLHSSHPNILLLLAPHSSPEAQHSSSLTPAPPGPGPAIRHSVPQIQASTPSMPAFHPATSQVSVLPCQHSSPSNPNIFTHILSVDSFHPTHATWKGQLGLGLSHWQAPSFGRKF